MIDTLFDISKVLVPGLLISVVTAIITVHLSLRRFYSERLWDRKMDAYTAIFEALYRLKHYNQLKHDIDLGDRSLCKDRAGLLEQQWADGDMEVGKAIDIGSFVIAEDAIACLRSFRERPRLSVEDDAISELAAQEMKYLDDCISALMIVAHRDLRVAKKGANKSSEATP